jgi:transcriptional regulator with XRE-family HTH domain
MAKLSLGRNLKKLRDERKFSQVALARLVGVSQAQISRLEDGQQGFRSDVVMRISKALKVRPWVLFMTDVERAAATKTIGLRG